jgi:dipeptidyl-peptidase-3
MGPSPRKGTLKSPFLRRVVVGWGFRKLCSPVFQARFIILKHLYEHGNGTLKMAYRPRTTELPPSLTIHLDRSRLSTDGRAAISNLLHRLHIYKCTGDAETGIPDLEAMTLVSGDYLLWHEIVSNQAKPPPLIVQGNLFLIDEKGKQINVPDSKILDASEAMDVVLRQYEPTVEGLVRSWVERRGG